MKFQKNHTVIRSHRDYNGLFMELRTRVCDIGIGAIARSYYRGQCVDCPEVPTSAEEFGKQHFCCMHLTDSYFE